MHIYINFSLDMAAQMCISEGSVKAALQLSSWTTLTHFSTTPDFLTQTIGPLCMI